MIAAIGAFLALTSLPEKSRFPTETKSPADEVVPLDSPAGAPASAERTMPFAGSLNA
jgi:hypothetical protein